MDVPIKTRQGQRINNYDAADVVKRRRRRQKAAVAVAAAMTPAASRRRPQTHKELDYKTLIFFF